MHVMTCIAMVLHCRQSILDVAGQVPPEVIEQLLEAAKSNSYQRMQQQVGRVAANSWSPQGVGGVDSSNTTCTLITVLPSCSVLQPDELPTLYVGALVVTHENMCLHAIVPVHAFVLIMPYVPGRVQVSQLHHDTCSLNRMC